MDADPTPDRASAAWSPRTVAAAAFVALFVAVQVTVPVLALDGPRPARFAWQMYSVLGEPPAQYSVQLADGSARAVDQADHVAYPRPDVRVAEHLPAHLCASVPGATSVLVEGAAASWEHRCD